MCEGSRAVALSCAGRVARARRWVVGDEDGAVSQEVPWASVLQPQTPKWWRAVVEDRYFLSFNFVEQSG